MNGTADVLADLEERVGAKYVAAVAARAPEWELPEFDTSSWLDVANTPLPEGTLQFPREQWVSYPAARTAALIAADRLLDFAETLTEEQWITLHLVMHYGGRTRVA